MTFFATSQTLAGFQLDNLGAGASIGVTFPFGWFHDNNLDTNLSIGAHCLSSLETLVPNLTARVNLDYQYFHGEQLNGLKSSFRDVSFYAEGLYSFDMGLPFKPYVLGGIGLDFTRIEWTEEYDHNHNRWSDNSIGNGIVLGMGMSIKTLDRFDWFAETQVKSSTWGTGPGLGDIAINIRLGATLYFYIH